jgi:hypothetical protein
MHALLVSLAVSIAGPTLLHHRESDAPYRPGIIRTNGAGFVLIRPRTLMVTKTTYIVSWHWPLDFELVVPVDTSATEVAEAVAKLRCPGVHISIHDGAPTDPQFHSR